MKKMIQVLTLLTLSGCDVDLAPLADATDFEDEPTECSVVLDCMARSCSLPAAASESRMWGYVAGCADACMAATGAGWGRTEAGVAFAECEVDGSACAEKLAVCELGR